MVLSEGFVVVWSCRAVQHKNSQQKQDLGTLNDVSFRELLTAMLVLSADDIVQGGPLLHQRPGPVYVEFAIPGDSASISSIQ